MTLKLKICKKTVMDSTDPNIVFDENGICKIRGKKKDKLIDLFSLISK